MKKLIVVVAVLMAGFAVRAQADDVVRVEVPGGGEVEMVRVSGGSFTMGCNTPPRDVRHHYEASAPEHRVEVGDFYIARFEVTQALWTAVMKDNPSVFVGDSMPVNQVSWESAVEFATLLSVMTGRRFRLPTEAEWEYAARGGALSKGTAYSGSGRAMLDRCAWYCVNSDNHVHAVGLLEPNELGLYDMSGNVAEWCQDGMSAYTEASQSNPLAADSGDGRILRGGHFESTSSACTVYDRSWYVPSASSRFFGLRLAMDAEPADSDKAK